MINELRLPEISENVTTATVIKILVKAGDFVQKDQNVVEMETEKAALEIPSPVQGKVIEINVKEGDQLDVGQIILKIDTEVKEGAETGRKKPAEIAFEKQKKEEAEKRKEISQPQPTAEPIPASPSVRQLARELGVDISRVIGTAVGGRISLEDVKNYAKNFVSGQSVKIPSVAPARQVHPLPNFTAWGEVERKPLTATRKKIADIMTYTWSTVPQVCQYAQADITELEEFRKECSEKVSQAGGKLTVTSILMKVAASALKEFPQFNASFDPHAQEIIYKKYCHISVAVDTERGLLVPVVRDVDKKSIVQLSVELTQLAQKARTHKVTPDEMVGGNFTITNLGGIGGTYFAPILYWPQVAILGVARAAVQPVYRDGKFEPRLMLPLSLSYDHRVIDGAQGLRFLRWIAESLEKPFLLTFDK